MNESSVWLYKKTDIQLYTVGFYDPSGRWEPESDHSSAEEAAKRVSYLNGNSSIAKDRQASDEGDQP